MRYNTENPVGPDGSNSPFDLFDNSGVIDLLLNGPLGEYLSRLGVPLKSWRGIMQQVTDYLIAQSYESIYLTYGPGVIVERQTQLVQRAGELYRVMNASDIPLTLTGTWATDAPKLQAVGDQALRQELANTSDPYLGMAMIGRAPLMFESVAELRANPGRFVGDRGFINNYLPGDGKGKGWVTYNPAAGPDDGGMRLGGWVRDLTPDGMIDASFWGLPLASGFNNVEFAAIEAYMFANRVCLKVGPGVYDNGPVKYPFRTGDVPSASFRNYNFAGIFASPLAKFQTTSANGNDVFNLVCVENFFICGFPQIEGFITTTLGSGTNGISVVHGGRNIYVEATCKDLPFIDNGSGAVDGGSACSLQATADSVLPFENVRFRVRSKGVSHGFSCTGPYAYFVNYPTKGCVLDIDVENAYRGAAIGIDAPSAAPATPPHVGITGSVRCRNVQQVLVDFRGDGAKLDVSVMNDLVKESLVFLASNPLVAVTQILAAKNFDHNVHGEIRSADTWLRIGGASMGGGVIGSTARGRLRQNVKFNAVTTPVDLVNSGGVAIAENELFLNGIVSGYSSISARSSTLFINGKEVHSTIYPGDVGVTLQPNAYTIVIFKVPLTATRAVVLPASGNIGDIVEVIRLASASGASAVQVLGVNYTASTNARFVYNGSAWERTDFGVT